MYTEYEVKVRNIDRSQLIEQWKSLWAVLEKPRTFFQRVVFKHPIDPEQGFVRVRNEWSKITCTSKRIDLTKEIDSVTESELIIDDFQAWVSFLQSLWLVQKAFQETYREQWKWWDVQLTIDERPGLKPFLEIEWPDKESVYRVIDQLGISHDSVIFGTVDEMYLQELDIPRHVINATPSLTFDNPPGRYKVGS